MRLAFLAFFAAGALAISGSLATAQTSKDQTPAKGQSERPKDPKHNEPESSSHNADKPTKQSSEPQTPAQTNKPEKSPKKDPG